MLPEPTVSFTVPSLLDDTELECRIHHPPAAAQHAAPPSPGEGPPWHKRGAIVQHPYAPLGGCYDDPVVDLVADRIRRRGYVVGTFNFRGAGNSQGKTSWSAKPERQDYVSFVGLFAHYLRALDPRAGASSPCPPSPGNTHLLSPLSAGSASDSPVPPPAAIALLVGGYSYGSLVATHLPPVPSILALFSHPEKGSAAAEIRLRAAHLAEDWNEECAARRRGRSSAVHGGEEGEPGSRRSRESSRRSVEILRRSVERTREKFSPGRRHSHEASTEARKLEAVDITVAQTAYLLVSPLLPPISSFLTLFAKHKPALREPKDETPESSAGCSDEFANHPTLIVHGDDDFFTSSKKLRKWTAELAARPGSQLRSVEVPNAGHFWHDPDAQRRLAEAVDHWTQELSKS